MADEIEVLKAKLATLCELQHTCSAACSEYVDLITIYDSNHRVFGGALHQHSTYTSIATNNTVCY